MRLVRHAVLAVLSAALCRGAPAVSPLAVYTYSIGGYDGLRSSPVPDVGDVDAFLFLDQATFTNASAQQSITAWRQKGWKVSPVALEKSSGVVSANRLTTKRLKFDPPAEVLEGRDWVATFDYNVVIDVRRLQAFVSGFKDEAAIFVDWRHYVGLEAGSRGGLGDLFPQRPKEWPLDKPSGFECLSIEANTIVSPYGRLHCFVSSTASRKNALRTYMQVQELELSHQQATGRTAFPYHFDLSIFFRRGTAHPSAKAVSSAFTDVLRDSAEVERDQLLLPLHLARHQLYPQIAVTSLTSLQRDLDHYVASFHPHEKTRTVNTGKAHSASMALLPPSSLVEPAEDELVRTRVIHNRKTLDRTDDSLRYSLPRLRWREAGSHCPAPSDAAAFADSFATETNEALF